MAELALTFLCGWSADAAYNRYGYMLYAVWVTACDGYEYLIVNESFVKQPQIQVF